MPKHAYIFFTVLFILLFAVFFYENPEYLTTVLSIPATTFSVLTGLIILTWIFSALQTYVVLDSIDHRPPFLQYFAITVFGILINYLPIRTGIAFRAFFLKKIVQLDYSMFSAITLHRIVVSVITCGLFCSLCLVLLFIRDDKWNGALLLEFVTLVAITCVVIIAVFKLSENQRTMSLVGAWIRSLIESLKSLSAEKSLSLKIVLLLFLQYICVGIRMLLCFKYAQVDIGLLEVCLLAPVGVILSMLAITPGGLGVREFFVAGLASLLGYDFAAGMHAMVIDRVVQIVVVAFAGSISLGYLRSHHSSYPLTKHS